MSRLNVGNLFNENEDGAPSVVGISTFSSPHYFIPPSGTEAERPQNPSEGMIRFNTDSGSLEYYRGTHWENIIVNNNNLGGGLNGIGTTNSPQGTGTRGLIGGGENPSATNEIAFITIDTLGDSQDFGDLTETAGQSHACASRVRGLFLMSSPDRKSVDKVTISSTGSAANYGDLIAAQDQRGAASNDIRGLFVGGLFPGSAVHDEIDAVTIASDGTAFDFGNLTIEVTDHYGCASPVRAVFGGGRTIPATNIIDFITISSTGDAQDFGSLNTAAGCRMSCSNATRGVWGGGIQSPGTTRINSIEFVTIASTGNAIDFGDLSDTRANSNGAIASPTRGVFCGGYNPGRVDIIECIQFASTGNVVDFGNLRAANQYCGACSNGHGGL